MAIERQAIRPPGFPCPSCKTRLVIDVMALVAGKDVVCGTCGLELKLDQERSVDALGAMRNHLDTLDAVEQALSDELEDFGAGPGQSKRRSRSPRRAARPGRSRSRS